MHITVQQYNVEGWPVDQQIQVIRLIQVVLLILVHHVSLCLPTANT